MSSRGGRGRRNYNGRGQGNGDMAIDSPNNGSSLHDNNNNQTNQLRVPHIEVRNWEGGTVNDLVGFLERKMRIKISNPKQNGNVVTIQIPANNTREIEKWNGVRFAGRNLQIKVVYKTQGPSPETSMAIQVLQGFLQSRYSPDAKLLNLTMMMSDPTLQSQKMLDTPEVATKMFKALMKLAGENLPNVESISLESNNLMDTELLLSVAEAYPKLLNLSLANNQISGISQFLKLRNKLPMLRELVLANNPIQQHPAFQSQVHELVNMFPRLLILDGVPVRSEAELPKNALPAPIRPTFFEDEGVASLTPMFLMNFFGLWDTNRSGLLPLYDQASLFSMCYNGGAPHLPTSRPMPPVYIQMSRNLERNNGQQARHNKVYVGQSAVAEAFNRIPQSKHDLANAAAFAMDALKVSDIRVPGDTAIMITVHGEFVELPSNQTRSFDRTLVVLPGPSGNYLIASDMLNVRAQSTLPTPSQPDVASQLQPQQPIQPQQTIQSSPGIATPPGTSPAPGAGGVMAPPVPGVPNIGAPPPGAMGGAPDQAMLVQELMKQTGLVAEFADMCLKQANYDLNVGLQLFQQSRAQLPPNAFQ